MNRRNAAAIAAHDARIIAEATQFQIVLYLGTSGGWVRDEAASLAEARNKAAGMLEAHPQTFRRPLIYAVSPAGRTVPCK